MSKCIKCGSYAFNLYKEGIDQGGLCDVHYWQGRAHRAEALAEQPAQQEPVAIVDANDEGYWAEVLPDRSVKVGQPLYTSPPAQQEHVERGSLRFYTNGVERQHWKADGSIDFKDKQGNVTMTIAAGSITSSQPSKPLTDEQIDAAIKAWFENEIVAGRQPFAKKMRAAIKAAHGIKENT